TFCRVCGVRGIHPGPQSLDVSGTHRLGQAHPADPELLQGGAGRQSAEPVDEQLWIDHVASIRHPMINESPQSRHLWRIRTMCRIVERCRTGADTPDVGRIRGKRPTSGVSAPKCNDKCNEKCNEKPERLSPGESCSAGRASRPAAPR